jgi:anti-anti-sigma regulatory factor
MLRITIHDGPGELRLNLEGRLAGPWVRELEQCWRTALSAVRDRPVAVDLTEVDFVDCAGEQLLARMHERGAKLIAATPMTSQIVAEITGG